VVRPGRQRIGGTPGDVTVAPSGTGPGLPKAVSVGHPWLDLGGVLRPLSPQGLARPDGGGDGFDGACAGRPILQAVFHAVTRAEPTTTASANPPTWAASSGMRFDAKAHGQEKAAASWSCRSCWARRDHLGPQLTWC
jgi:hypothetical protein